MSGHLSSGFITAEINAVLKNVLPDGAEAQVNCGEQNKVSLTDGTTAAKANRGFQSKGRTLASAASEVVDTFDLAALDIGAGAGKDQLGLGQQNVELVGLMIVNTGDTSYGGDLLVGGEGSGAAWSDFIKSDTVQLRIPPKSYILIGTSNDPGWLITDVTSHLLKFAASGGNVKYNLYWLTRDA